MKASHIVGNCFKRQKRPVINCHFIAGFFPRFDCSFGVCNRVHWVH